jgi:SOS-response transcriptional repressor LexA
MPFEPPERRSCQRSSQTQATDEAVFDFIVAYSAEHGFAPSQREIARQCYISLSMVARYLDRLELSGRITRTGGQARSIRVVEGGEKE